MKTAIRKTLAILLLISVFAASAACKKEPPAPTFSDYTYRTESTTASVQEPDTVQSEFYTVDPSWQRNFEVAYKYYDKSTSEQTVLIKETRNENAFSAVYPETGNMIYYKANGDSIDSYTVVPSEEQFVHSVLKGKSISDLSSTYMKLTTVAEDLPTYTNVLFMADETVAGRACKKYIQRAYTDGKVTETVYVWVDSLFGICLKCEDYDADDVLQTYWETISFSTGNVTDSSFGFDLSIYDFTEGEQ